MNEVDVSWGRAIKVWWSLVWRGLLFGGIAGFIAGLIMALAGAGEHAGIAGGLSGIPVGVWVIKTVIGSEYSDFRIVLVPTAHTGLPAI